MIVTLPWPHGSNSFRSQMKEVCVQSMLVPRLPKSTMERNKVPLDGPLLKVEEIAFMDLKDLKNHIMAEESPEVYLSRKRRAGSKQELG